MSTPLRPDPSPFLRRVVPRLGLSRVEVAAAIGVSANTVDLMVREGYLPKPRRWHSRKVWLMSDLEAALAAWPEDGRQELGGDADDGADWRASA